MPSLPTRQGALAFNQPLNFDTSSVNDMSSMFAVRSVSLPPISSQAVPCTLLAPTRTLPSPIPHRPLCKPSLPTQQNAFAFNQPLSFNTSSVRWMGYMFAVRSVPLPPISSWRSPCTRCSLHRRLTALRPPSLHSWALPCTQLAPAPLPHAFSPRSRPRMSSPSLRAFPIQLGSMRRCSTSR